MTDTLNGTSPTLEAFAESRKPKTLIKELDPELLKQIKKSGMGSSVIKAWLETQGINVSRSRVDRLLSDLRND